jgi:hypothetical protein
MQNYHNFAFPYTYKWFLRNNFISAPMKKFFVIIVSVVFFSASLSSCRSHERCAAYGKINKIDTGKSFTDKTEKPI